MLQQFDFVDRAQAAAILAGAARIRAQRPLGEAHRVGGLENFKWADKDAPRYAVTIPFIRNLAGPMDYTSGAMRNVTQADFKARNHAPMAKGTRCNQLAQYVVFEVPFQMLSDSPSI